MRLGSEETCHDIRSFLEHKHGWAEMSPCHVLGKSLIPGYVVYWKYSGFRRLSGEGTDDTCHPRAKIPILLGIQVM